MARLNESDNTQPVPTCFIIRLDNDRLDGFDTGGVPRLGHHQIQLGDQLDRA